MNRTNGIVLLTLCASASTFAAVNTGDGLVAYWSFDQDFAANSGGAAYDLEAYGDNGEVPEVLGAGRFGGAAAFERDNREYLRTSASTYTEGGDLTYAAWYRLDTTISGGDRHFVMETDEPYARHAISYGLRDDNGNRGQVYTKNTSYVNSSFYVDNGSSQGAENGVWHSIVVTLDADLDGGTYTAYLDGVEAGSVSDVGTIWGGHGLVVGGHRDGTGRNFEGLIDDVAVWDRVLNTDEIDYLQSNPVMPVPEPAAGALGLGIVALASTAWSRRKPR